MPPRIGTPLRLTDATPDDATWLAPVAARLFRTAFADANDPVDMAAYLADAFSVGAVRTELAATGTTTLLAHDDADGADRFLGYASLVVGTEDGVGGERPVELRRLYVESDLTGRGIGRRLMAAVLDRAAADGHDVVWLGVWEHNHGAQRFYRAHGFVEVGRHDFLLGGDLQTDLVLARPL